MLALRSLGRSITWVALLTSLGGIGLGLLGRFSPELDLLANIRWHLLGFSFAALLALWINYRPMLVLALGGCLTLSAHTLIAQESEWPPIGAKRIAGTQAGSWTILSLNTWHHHPDPEGLAGYLAAANADVVVLTEMGPNKLAMLHTLKAAYPYRKDCVGDWDCAIAVLSRHPFTASGSVPESDASGPARVWLTFGTGKAALTVIGTHIQEPLRSPRLHLFQLAQLAWATRNLHGEMLVAGDINTTPWSNAYRDFTEQSGLHPMGRFLPTFPAGSAGLPQLAMDHIFASGAVTFDEVWLGPDVASDHRPVLARIMLPAETLAALR